MQGYSSSTGAKPFFSGLFMAEIDFVKRTTCLTIRGRLENRKAISTRALWLRKNKLSESFCFAAVGFCAAIGVVPCAKL